MKEKALGELLLKQSIKVLDGIEKKVSVEEVCADFNHCAEADIEDFKNRMVGGKKKETPKVETKETPKKSGLTSRSLRG